MSEEKILKRDDKLLKNEKSWRRARIGIFIIAPIQIFSFIICFAAPSTVKAKIDIPYAAMLAFSVFWLLVLDLLNMRLRHIDSIKLYRSKIK
jgi:hypothetical protein